MTNNNEIKVDTKKPELVFNFKKKKKIKIYKKSRKIFRLLSFLLLFDYLLLISISFFIYLLFLY